MFTIIASQDRPAQRGEACEILTKATLLETREFTNGVVIARFATEHGAYVCTVERADNLKLWLDDSYSAIVDKYDFLTQSNLYTE
jgi:hypothetical protein|nr:MAG TPA: hypothetical protein [Caudoviricetes sp.]